MGEFVQWNFFKYVLRFLECRSFYPQKVFARTVKTYYNIKMIKSQSGKTATSAFATDVSTAFLVI